MKAKKFLSILKILTYFLIKKQQKKEPNSSAWLLICLKKYFNSIWRFAYQTSL
jgi:hypothetical protein